MKAHSLALRRVRVALSLAMAAICMPASPASAQLYELGSSSVAGNSERFQGAAYDPVHDCYLAVSVGTTVRGFFINRAGHPIGAPVLIDTRRQDLFSRVVYSPDLGDGVGGFGAFVVLWSSFDARGPLFAQIVSYPGRLVGQRVTVIASTPARPYYSVQKADIAYSPADRVFLVAVGLQKGLRVVRRHSIQTRSPESRCAASRRDPPVIRCEPRLFELRIHF